MVAKLPFPSATDCLIYLTISGVCVGFISVIVSQLFESHHNERDGKKTLSAAGKISLGIAAASFLISIGSEMLKLSIEAVDAKLKDAAAAEDKNWKIKSAVLANQILINTRAQLDASEKNFRNTIDGLRDAERAARKTDRSVIASRDRVISSFSQSSVTVSMEVDCNALAYKAYCHKGDPAYSTPLFDLPTERWVNGTPYILLYMCLYQNVEKYSVINTVRDLHCDTLMTIQAVGGSAGVNFASGPLGAGNTTLSDLKLNNSDITSNGKVTSLADLSKGGVYIWSPDQSLEDLKRISITLLVPSGEYMNFNVIESSGDGTRACKKNIVHTTSADSDPLKYYTCKRGSGLIEKSSSGLHFWEG